MNRETWLQNGATELRKIFNSLGYTVPDFQVSIGLPSGGCHNRTLGECYSKSHASNRVASIFISPRIPDPITVLETLLHEMIHVENDVQDGHNARFAKIAGHLGLVGQPTATQAGRELYYTLQKIAKKLGPYPHVAMSFDDVTTQKTYMIKLSCKCGYIVRTTQTHINKGLPKCPKGHKLEPQ